MNDEALAPSRSMALGTIASRASGFLRTAVIAAALGPGLLGDAYNVANTTPNIVYELLLGGVLTSFVVPLLVAAGARDGDGGEAYGQRLLTLVTVGLTALSALAVLAGPWIVRAYLHTCSPAQEHLATVFVRYFLPQILFYGVGATMGAVLNARGSFTAPMWAPVLNNAVVIGTGIAFLTLTHGHPSPGRLGGRDTLLLGLGTTAGIVAQAVALLPALRASGFHWRWRLDFAPGELSSAANLARWAFVYVVANQVAYVVVVRLATGAAHCGAKGRASGFSPYAYAFQLFQLPHAVIAVSIITALLPRMSRHATEGRLDLVRADVSTGWRSAAVLLVPASIGALVLGRELAVVLLAHGNTTVADARYIGTVLACFTLGLVPFSFFQLALRAFNAQQDARTPALVNIAVNVVNLAVDVALYLALPSRVRVAGLALGWAVSYAVGLAILVRLLARRTEGVDGPRVTRTVTRLVAASLPAALLAGLGAFVAHAVLGWGGAGSLMALLLGGGTGLVVFTATARRLRISELGAVGALLRARARG
ncbi:MAG: putative peptidoglycan lipid flippase [Frankiaceae bacterium]|nr:putative peptidoglycan lipid flippase [Frankiaceae bacterium]